MTEKKQTSEEVEIQVGNGQIDEFPGTEDEFKPRSMDELVGKVIVVLEFEIEESERYGRDIATILISEVGQKYEETIRTGSQGIIKALKKYGHLLPWKAKIVKDGNAYYFGKP